MPQQSYSKVASYHYMNSGIYDDTRTPGVQYVFDQTHNEARFYPDVTLVRNENPDWKVKVAKSQDASSYYYRDGWSWKTADAQCKTKYLAWGGAYVIKGIGRTRFLGTTYLPSLSSTEDTTTRDIALASFKRKLSLQQGNARLLVPTVELKELHGLVRGALDITGQFLEVCRLSLLKRGMHLTQKVASAYLAWVFGLKPMIGDINNALSAIEEWLTRSDKHVRIRGGKSKTWSDRLESLNNIGTYGASVDAITDVSYKLSYRYVGAYDLLIESANDYGVYEHLGFTPSEIIPAVWELIPFSWVFDYFTTIGSFLEDAFSSSPGSLKYLVLDKKLTVRGDVSVYYKLAPNSLGSEYFFESHAPGRGWWEYWQFSRTPLTALPHRALRFQTLDAIGNFGLSKLLNLTAVLVNSQKK